MTATTTSSDTLLRTTLYANTAFCFVSGVVLAAAAGPVGDFSRLDPLILRVVGIGLVLWSAILARFSGRRPLRRAEVLTVISGDVAWVVGTAAVALTASSSFTGAGLVTFIVVGIIVADFATAQWIGLRRADLS